MVRRTIVITLAWGLIIVSITTLLGCSSSRSNSIPLSSEAIAILEEMVAVHEEEVQIARVRSEQGGSLDELKRAETS